MKKVLLMAMFVIVSSLGYSQAKMGLGIKVGANISTLKDDASTDYKDRRGYLAGIFFLAKFGKIGIQPEVIYSQQGADINNTNFVQHFNYFNVPVMVKYYVAGGFHIQAGPQIGFLESATGPVVSGGSSGTVYTGDISSKVTSTDFSAAFGAGFDFPFGLTLDARYNLGLSDANNHSASGSSTVVKNQVIQMSVGYRLFKFGI